MTNKREVRFDLGQDHELRVSTNEKGQRTVTGRAIPYNALSSDMGFREMISPTAFRSCLAGNPDLLLLTEHDVKRGVLARTSSGTLTVSSDDLGLNFTASLPATTLGNDTAISMDRGDLRNMSFAFSCNEDKWEKGADGTHVRTVLDAELYELSIVSSPAYPQSTAAIRSLMFPDGAPTAPPEETRDDTKCSCTCAECVAGDCAECSDPDCELDGCSCGDSRTHKLLIACLERRLR